MLEMHVELASELPLHSVSTLLLPAVVVTLSTEWTALQSLLPQFSEALSVGDAAAAPYSSWGVIPLCQDSSATLSSSSPTR